MSDIKVTWSKSGAPEQQVIDTRRRNAGRHLYMYLDESGNLDFKPSGTPFFVRHALSREGRLNYATLSGSIAMTYGKAV